MSLTQSRKDAKQEPFALKPKPFGLRYRSANGCDHDWEDLDYLFIDTANSADSGMKVLQRCRRCWLERVVRR